MGLYNEDSAIGYGPGPVPLNTILTISTSTGQLRLSTSLNVPFNDNVSTLAHRPTNHGMLKNNIIAKGPAILLSQLPQDVANAKLFQAPNYDDLHAPSPNKSIVDPLPTDHSGGISNSNHAKWIMD